MSRRFILRTSYGRGSVPTYPGERGVVLPRWLASHKEAYQCALLILMVMCLLAFKSEEFRPEDLGEPWAGNARLIAARDYAGAIDRFHSYAKSISNVEDLAAIYYGIGLIHYEFTHNYDQALDAYQKVVDLGKEAKSLSELESFTALSQMQMAGIYCRVTRYDDAVKIYREVIADFPGTAYATVAVRYIKGIEDALAEIELQRQVIAKYPNTEFAAEAQFEIAELYLSIQNLNNPQQAIQEYKRLIDQYPNSRRAMEAQLKIGNIYWSTLHKPEEAISAYQKLVRGRLSASKLEAEAVFRIGRVYYSDLHDYEKALDTFTRFLKDYPTYWKFPAAVYWQGKCYEHLKDYDNAIRAFEMFVQISPDEKPGWLADIEQLDVTNIKEQIRLKIGELDKLAYEARWREAERLSSLGKYHEALTVYRELICKYPDSEYSEKAKYQADRMKNLAEIQICRDTIKRGDMEAPASQFRIAEIYEEMQDYPLAIEEYEKVTRNYPDTYWAADALYRTGLIHSGSSDLYLAEKTEGGIKPDYDKAIGMYHRLIQKYPNTYTAAKAYYQMGEIYKAHLKNYKRALEAYSKVANDFPKRNLYVGEGYTDSLADEAQFKVGRIYYENLQDYDMALKAFTKLLNDYPDSCRKAASYSFIAAIQERQKDLEAAADSLERIIDIIVDSDVQSSFFFRHALYDRSRTQEGILSGFDPQRDTIDIIKQLRWKVSQLRDRVASRQETDSRVK